MPNEELKQAIAWFENRLSSATMPGTRKMFGMALLALRERQERDNPQPLSLDELWEMGGEPVWCKGKSRFGVNFEAWKVLSKYSSTEEVIRFTDGDDRLPESYGKAWLAYRYKPKEAQDGR